MNQETEEAMKKILREEDKATEKEKELADKEFESLYSQIEETDKFLEGIRKVVENEKATKR